MTRQHLSAAIAALLLPFALAGTAHAAPAFRGQNFSGIYDCTGQDASEGEYTGSVTLQLVREQSTGFYGAYSFQLEVPGYGVYPGHAAASGRHMAIHFAHTDPSLKDYGTGIASFRKTRTGKWVFEKFYYEPEFKGGNHGKETCRQR